MPSTGWWCSWSNPRASFPSWPWSEKRDDNGSQTLLSEQMSGEVSKPIRVMSRLTEAAGDLLHMTQATSMYLDDCWDFVHLALASPTSGVATLQRSAGPAQMACVRSLLEWAIILRMWSWTSWSRTPFLDMIGTLFVNDDRRHFGY